MVHEHSIHNPIYELHVMSPDGTSINKVSREKRLNSTISYNYMSLSVFRLSRRMTSRTIIRATISQLQIRDEIEGEYTPFPIIWAVFALSMTAV